MSRCLYQLGESTKKQAATSNESSLMFLAHPRRLRRLARWRWWCKVGYAHFAPPSPTGLSRFSGEPGLRGNVSLAPETSGMTHTLFLVWRRRANVLVTPQPVLL